MSKKFKVGDQVAFHPIVLRSEDEKLVNKVFTINKIGEYHVWLEGYSHGVLFNEIGLVGQYAKYHEIARKICWEQS